MVTSQPMPWCAMHSLIVGMPAKVCAIPAARAWKSESRLLRAVCAKSAKPTAMDAVRITS